MQETIRITWPHNVIIKNQANVVTNEPEVKIVIKVRTSIQNGEIILPNTKLHSGEIPDCIMVSRNGDACFLIMKKRNLVSSKLRKNINNR